MSQSYIMPFKLKVKVLKIVLVSEFQKLLAMT